METTVLEFFPALEAGNDPKNHSYAKEQVPLGTYAAKLGFMLWSKSGLNDQLFYAGRF